MRVEGRGKTVEETLARSFVSSCLRQEKKRHKAGNLSPLPSPVYPLLRGRRERFRIYVHENLRIKVNTRV